MMTTSLLEASRIVSILSVALDELDLLSVVSNTVATHSSSVHGDEVSREIAAQQSLEAQFDNLSGQRALYRAACNVKKTKEVQRDIGAMLQLLKQGMRDLGRSLRVGEFVQLHIYFIAVRLPNARVEAQLALVYHLPSFEARTALEGASTT